jgi:hypothetical protein
MGSSETTLGSPSNKDRTAAFRLHSLDSSLDTFVWGAAFVLRTISSSGPLPRVEGVEVHPNLYRSNFRDESYAKRDCAREPTR